MEWKEISFSSLFASTSDYTGDSKTYPLYSLTIEEGVIPKTERYARNHLVKKEDAYKIVRPDDFVYNPMNLRFGAVARYKGTQPVSVSGYYDVFTTTYKSDLPFMDNFLVCGPMLTYYDRVSMGSLVEKQRVHFASFINFSFPLPPREEREKIARILMTQDRVITLREKLLAEKLRQKQYLMQVLLTGKKRLPGFSEKWKLVHLKDLCAYVRRRSVNSFDTYVSNENISSNLKGMVHFGEERHEVAGIKYRKGDILIGNIRPYLKKIWLADRDGICSSDILVLRPSNISSSCMYNLIATDTFFSYMMTGAGGSKMPRGDKKQVMEYPLQIPQSVKEQDEISHIFSLINEEIELLRQALEQERQKKKALMQLLLSGIVRVKP